MTIPVAFFKRQGIVTLSHTCDTNTFPRRTGHARCTATMANGAAIAANVDLKVRNVGDDEDLEFSNPTPPATTHHGDEGIDWSGTLTPVVPPQVTAITPTVGPAGGYLPLSALGVAPIARRRRRHDHELQRAARSCTAASRTRASGSSRTATS